ncbi:hypothetical protein C8T65DRAFT_285354 [Cerioporus squamosus]|nr:hypothetical protein C8T65DRAFT_285354 [Cerioporus squamosus]
MSQDTRPAKRARVQGEEHSLDDNAVEHDEEFWFEDGNVVLVARNTGFRIYRGLLAAQSSVFADMFAASSPDDTESYDGCPMVQLTDTPEDVRDLLRVLLPKSRRVYHEELHDHPFEEALAIIRLAHKYHIDDILQQALRCVLASYPATFGEYVSLKTEPRWEHAISVVSIARLTDMQSMLPLALYRCCCLGGDLVDGWERRDGSVEMLSMQDLKRCVSGRDMIAREAVSFVARIFNGEPNPDCVDDCDEVLEIIRTEALEHEHAGSCGILDTWDEFIDISAAEKDVCGSCTLNMKLRHAEERAKVWMKLPGWFGLTIDGWGG